MDRATARTGMSTKLDKSSSSCINKFCPVESSRSLRTCGRRKKGRVLISGSLRCGLSKALLRCVFGE